jgi:hypothetical protein
VFWCKLGGVLGGESEISESDEYDDGNDMVVFFTVSADQQKLFDSL